MAEPFCCTDYARVSRWELPARDGFVRVVSGSDVVVWGGDDAGGHAAERCSVRLLRAEAAADLRVRRRAVLDSWLDNVVAGVPRLALCLEREGVVVGAKVVDTGDIPSLAFGANAEEAVFDAPSLQVHAAAALPRAGTGSFDVASTSVFSKRYPSEKHPRFAVRPERCSLVQK